MGWIALVVMVAVSALQMMQKNKALDDAAHAKAMQTQMEVNDLQRQIDENNQAAQAAKSDRVREADKKTGQMMAMMADGGRAGTANEARYAGEIGFFEGIDVARIEGKRRANVDQLNSSIWAKQQGYVNFLGDVANQKQANRLEFVASSAKMASSYGAAGGGSSAPNAAMDTQYGAASGTFGKDGFTQRGGYSIYD